MAPRFSEVDPDDSVLHAKVDAALVSAAVSKDMLARLDSKLDRISSQMREFEKYALVVGAVIVANIVMSAVMVMIMVGR